MKIAYKFGNLTIIQARVGVVWFSNPIDNHYSRSAQHRKTFLIFPAILSSSYLNLSSVDV